MSPESGTVQNKDMGKGNINFKLLFFLFNWTLLVGGFFVTGIGIHMLFRIDKYLEVCHPNKVDLTNITEVDPLMINYRICTVSEYVDLFAISCFVIFIGILVVILPLLGCCAACFESKYMMGCFAGLTLLALIMEIAIGTLFIIYKDVALEIFEMLLFRFMVLGPNGNPNP